MFFNTFVFQAGLVNLLFHKFKGTILLSAAYLALSISFHIWLMVSWGGLGAAPLKSPSHEKKATAGTIWCPPPCITPCHWHQAGRELPHPSPFPKGHDLLANPLSLGEAQGSSSSLLAPRSPGWSNPQLKARQQLLLYLGLIPSRHQSWQHQGGGLKGPGSAHAPPSLFSLHIQLPPVPFPCHHHPEKQPQALPTP